MNIEKLKENICDQILEAQLKLGYARETIRLYFPLNSLNRILETGETDAGSLCLRLTQALQAFPELGTVECSHRGDRIGISVPPEGTAYVHEKIPASDFLRDLIRLFAEEAHCSPEQIEAVFRKASPDYILTTMPEGAEFDWAIHFADPAVDPYYYCFRMEMGHTIYHRFLEADYRELL